MEYSVSPRWTTYVVGVPETEDPWVGGGAWTGVDVETGVAGALPAIGVGLGGGGGVGVSVGTTVAGGAAGPCTAGPVPAGSGAGVVSPAPGARVARASRAFCLAIG